MYSVVERKYQLSTKWRPLVRVCEELLVSAKKILIILNVLYIYTKTTRLFALALINYHVIAI